MTSAGAVRRMVAPVVFIAAYVLAARLTEGVNLESGFAPWYPPAGLALAYLVYRGPRAAGTAVVARLVMVAVTAREAYDVEPEGVVIRALAITACYAAAAEVLRRVGLHRLRLTELGWFTAVGVVAAPLGGAIVVALVEILVLDSPSQAAFDAAWTFWIGDAVAIAAIVPAVLMVIAAAEGHIRPPRLPASRHGRLEVAIQGGALIVSPVLALSLAGEGSGTGFLALAVVPAIWVASRNDLLFVAVGLLALNVTLSVVASLALGPTVELAELQAVMLTATLAGLYVAAFNHSKQMSTADLIESEERYRSLLDAAPDLVLRFTPDGTPAAASHPAWLDAGEGIEPILDALRRAWPGIGMAVLADGVPRSVELDVGAEEHAQHLLARFAAERRADGEVAAVVAVVSDLTAQRHVLAMLDHERRYDALTGVANRTLFLNELDALAAVGTEVALAVVDIDSFGAVNDTFGPERGDSVLRELADRLRRIVGPQASLGRLGADQFAIAFEADEQSASALGGELLRAMRMRVAEGDQELFLTGSVGMAIGAEGNRGRLLSDADAAMHAAKESGRDRVVLLDDARRAASLDRRGTLSHLRACIERRELVVHYQPIVELENGVVRGLEALVRLPAPDGDGLLFPGSFLPIAEETALDVELGALVLETALTDLAWLQSVGADPLTMSVNVTARQLTLPGFVHTVLAACRRHGVDPSSLRLELTETLVLADADAAVHALRELRAMGISAALDDFGVGYSSMVHLQQLPIDVLKIDRGFVSGLPDDGDDRAIVGLILGLADALGLEVTAEGIETEAQRLALLDLGCTRGQGYLFARPAPLASLALPTSS